MPSVHLRPVEPTDYPALRRFELDLTLGPRWRHRGATPSPEAFVQALWSGVLALYLVESSHRREPVGLVSAYGHDLQSGFAWLAAARFDLSDHPAPFLLGLRAFVDHLFATWPLRKLYAEVLAPNLVPFASAATTLFDQEGILRDHAFVDGRHVDQHLLSLTRPRWDEERQRWAGTPTALGITPSVGDLARDLAELLQREGDPLDVDLPLADQGLDSLDWLIVADHLEHLSPTSETIEEALLDHVTLRAVHRHLLEGAVRAGGPRFETAVRDR